MLEPVKSPLPSRMSAGMYARVAGTIVVGGVLVGILAGTVVVIIPIAVAGGNGPQLAGIAFVSVFVVSAIVGFGVGAGSALIGSLLGFAFARSSHLAVELVALAFGAAAGAIPVGFLVAAIMGWDSVATPGLIALLSALGSLFARVIVGRRARTVTLT